MPRKRRPNPFALRLSDEQRAALKDRSARAGLSMGGYALSVIFNTPAPRRRAAAPTADLELLARVLASLGKTGSTTNQLARTANMGGWPDSRELAQACADIREMRDALMLALGVTPPDHPPGPPQPPAP